MGYYISALFACAALTMVVFGGGDQTKPTPAPTPAASNSSEKPILDWAKPILSQEQISAARKAGVAPAIEIDLGHKAKLRMVFIPPGEFVLGSSVSEKDRQANEGPQRKVKISHGFYICITEFTRAQRGKYRDAEDRDNYPVVDIEWYKIRDIIKGINGKFEGDCFRLPTELEWEYACRAGSNTRFSYGDDINYTALIDYAWFYENSRGKIHSVGEKRPNKWGLYDMHGNAAELCEETYRDSYANELLGDKVRRNDSHVLRGGSWNMGAMHCRSSARYGSGPSVRYNAVGFRLIKTLRSDDRTSLVPPAPVISPEEKKDVVKTIADFTSEEFQIWADTNLSQEQKDGAKKAGVAPAIEIDIGKGVKVMMVFIPPGEFMMGSPAGEIDQDDDEWPRHKVSIKDGFYICVTEVTQAQWTALMNDNPSKFKDDHNPVEVEKRDSVNNFLSGLNSKQDGPVFMLPSEAQWEYACRAGTKTRYSYGNDENYSGLQDYAWYEKNSGEKTHPVGKKKPNRWGLYDMHGNVREWCADDYQNNYQYVPADGKAWKNSNWQYWSCQVLRGGSWRTFPWACRSAFRSKSLYYFLHQDSDSDSGFRFIRTIQK